MWKVLDKKFKKLYALKEISKVKVIDKKSVNTIKYERELLCHLNHPLIINLHYAFQDYDNLYFVLDLLSGGDLRYQIGHHPRKYFSEIQVKFFVACIVESLIYIHSQNIIHRDIKPENLVFDEKGYLHVTDFGIAKISTEDNLNETSGTPGYMAPEVMRGLNHTGSVDYFAVGIIAYELMLGKRPYLGKSRKEIKEQMMIKQVFLDEDSIPLGWSRYAADFINRLLLRKDTNRLGYYNDLEVKRHPWLRNINFNDLVNYKIRAPFIPRRNHDNYDKKYCEEIEQIGINTNLKYEEYRNDQQYYEIFEGFTFYNVDESQFIKYNDICKRPNEVKNIKNNLYLNNNDDYFKKSRTINLDYDYKNKIKKNLSPMKNQDLLSNIKIPNNSRTINYSKSNDSTNRKTPISNKHLNYNRSRSCYFLSNSKISPKNKEHIYIMASPVHRGRITINSNDNNIDKSFRKIANHSFVETNYSKGKVIRRSYSSSNLYSNNCVNIVNLLVNNVNNINNNNIVINYNNDFIDNKYNYHNNHKISTPVSYNKINKSKIPFDKRPAGPCAHNYNNISYHNHHRSLIEKPKNNFFYYIDNKNVSYNYNINNYNNKTYKYRNRNLNNIINESFEDEKNYIYKYQEKELKNNYSSYKINQNMPYGCIKKVIPINLKDTGVNKSNTIDLEYRNKRFNNTNYNKIKTIDYIDIGNMSNNSFYEDKYENNKKLIQENKNCRNNEQPKELNKIYNYNDKNFNNHHHSNSMIIEKNINKRNSQIDKSNNSYNHININSMNNNYKNITHKNSRNINNSNNEITKNLSYKKIPMPSSNNKGSLRKIIYDNINENINYDLNSLNKINI